VKQPISCSEKRKHGDQNKLTKLKVAKKDERGYILENGTIIEDTFAEMFPFVVTSPAENPPFF